MVKIRPLLNCWYVIFRGVTQPSASLDTFSGQGSLKFKITFFSPAGAGSSLNTTIVTALIILGISWAWEACLCYRTDKVAEFCEMFELKKIGLAVLA